MTEQVEMTQELANLYFAQIKKNWDKEVAKSGETEKMFLVLNKTEQSSFLLYTYYQHIKLVESQGFVMPVLVEGLDFSELKELVETWINSRA